MVRELFVVSGGDGGDWGHVGNGGVGNRNDEGVEVGVTGGRG